MSLDDARAAAQATREQLADTLDQLEDKINVPRKLGALSKKAQNAYGENPTPFIIGAGAVAAVALGLLAWAVFGRNDD